MTRNERRWKSRIWTMVICIVAVVTAGTFLYIDRHNDVSNVLQSWGILGILASIVLMTCICVTPLPSEGALVVLLKVYGVWWGILYAWVGAILSSFIVFELARQYGRPVLKWFITPERFVQVDQWVHQRGTGGLLAARLLPIPGFVLSYVVGTIPSVRLFAFVWTAAVAMIPYYVGAALVYLGVAHRLVVWLFLGLTALAVVWGAGMVFRHRFHGDE